MAPLPLKSRVAPTAPEGGIADQGSALAECLESYLREIESHPLLAAAEERALARRAAGGDGGARRELISANLRLVVKIARRYAAYGVPLCDLIQEGNLGLIKAAERFDWQRGTRFSTYAVYWIRERILRALTTSGRAVQLSVHAFKRFRALAETADSLAAGLLREPTLAEVADAAHITVSRAARLFSAAAFSAPLGGPVDGGGPSIPLEEVACECTCDPAEVVEEHAAPTRVQDAISALDERLRWIVVHSFGLDGTKPLTLKQMAQVLGISAERVRQLRERALAILRESLVGVIDPSSS